MTTYLTKTPNQHFNRYAQILAEYHELADLGGYPTLDLTNRPKITAANWPEYANALIGLLTIGQRQGWTRLNVTRTGHSLYILIDANQPRKEPNP